MYTRPRRKVHWQVVPGHADEPATWTYLVRCTSLHWGRCTFPSQASQRAPASEQRRRGHPENQARRIVPSSERYSSGPGENDRCNNASTCARPAVSCCQVQETPRNKTHLAVGALCAASPTSCRRVATLVTIVFMHSCQLGVICKPSEMGCPTRWPQFCPTKFGGGGRLNERLDVSASSFEQQPADHLKSRGNKWRL